MTKPEWPPITDEQREAMKEDFSDFAVEVWATRLLKHGFDEALRRSEEYRTGYWPGTPGAAFWSRVRVRILTSREEEPSASDPAPPPAAAAPPTVADVAAEITFAETVTSPAALKSGGCTLEYLENPDRPLRWFEQRQPQPRAAAAPAPKPDDEPEQGRLF